jgi:hypothetical protein
MQYLTELSPWERKNEYYNKIQLGEDVRSQTEALRSAINSQTRTQLVASSAMVASQERISEGINELTNITNEGFSNIANGIEGLRSSFEFGISEVVWQLEQNRNTLINILQVLMAPLDTQAKERRKRAEKAYSNGWYEDAEEEFLESEKLNKYDFAIHISLGMIYLFHKVDKEKSLTYFEKAIKYARPESKYYTSFALLYKGLIKHDFGFIEKAKDCAVEASTLYPDLSEAHYQSAQYYALLGSADKSISFLRTAIEHDVKYLIKVQSDKAFEQVKNEVNILVEEPYRNQKNKAKKFNKLNSKISQLDSLDNELSEHGVNSVKGLSGGLKRIKTLLHRDSYFDYLEANKLILSSEKDFESRLSKMKNEVRNKLDSIPESSHKHSEARESFFEGMGVAAIIIGLLFFVMPFVAWLITEENKGFMDWLFCWLMLIPIVNWIIVFADGFFEPIGQWTFWGSVIPGVVVFAICAVNSYRIKSKAKPEDDYNTRKRLALQATYNKLLRI